MTDTSTTDASIEGFADDRFEGLKAEFKRQLESGEELGASLAVVEHGKPVLDLWGGYLDGSRTGLWQRDTITNVWSTTKTVVALAALMLVDRGELDVDAPVARYWPEFAQNGKADITVKQIMSHTSGVSGWAAPFTTTDLYDYEKAVAVLAAQPPWWEPGTASGYHLLNYGHLVGEVVRRISGKSVGTFVREEIAEPLGADFTIGLEPSEFHRISNVVPPPPVSLPLDQLPPNSPALLTYTAPILDATATFTSEWRTAEIGGANGHGNARSVARIQSVLTNGGEVDGVRLLSQPTIDRIFERQSDNVDLVLFAPLRFGIGYALPSASTPNFPDGRIAYWGGWGGSIILNDVDRGITFSYVMNRMGSGLLGTPRGDAYEKALYAALG